MVSKESLQFGLQMMPVINSHYTKTLCMVGVLSRLPRRNVDHAPGKFCVEGTGNSRFFCAELTIQLIIPALSLFQRDETCPAQSPFSAP
jgi:hypothetical protein